MIETNKQTLVILCTCPERITAEKLAKEMVEQKLAACVNIINDMTSVYVWDNAVQIEPEVQLIIKTSEAKMPELKSWLLKAHPYEVPEIIALPIVDGNENYLNWVLEQTDKNLSSRT